MSLGTPHWRSVAKFYLKMRAVRPLRSILLALFGPQAERTEWEKRMLIVNLEALGDLIIFTGVLKNYRTAFPGHRLTLLIKAGTGLEPFLAPQFVDEVVSVDYRKFASNPWYGFNVIRGLRKIGFQRVINQDFSASEIQGKIISLAVGAEFVSGSDGQALEHAYPFDYQQKRNLEIVESLLRGYTEIIPTKYAHRGADQPGALEYYVKIFETVSGKKGEYATEFPSRADGKGVITKFGLSGRPFFVLNVSASGTYKRWPTERFAAVAPLFMEKSWVPVVIGSKADEALAARFANLVPGTVDLAGRTSLEELREIIASASFVFTNDTSTVHMAIALKRPCLAIAGAGPGGMLSDYGHRDIHAWITARLACYGDNWQCIANIREGSPAICMAAVTVEEVKKKADAMLRYIEAKKGEEALLPAEPFEVKFEPVL